MEHLEDPPQPAQADSGSQERLISLLEQAFETHWKTSLPSTPLHSGRTYCRQLSMILVGNADVCEAETGGSIDLEKRTQPIAMRCAGRGIRHRGGGSLEASLSPTERPRNGEEEAPKGSGVPGPECASEGALRPNTGGDVLGGREPHFTVPAPSAPHG